MKRLHLFLSFILLVSIILPRVNAAETSIKVSIDGQEMTFNPTLFFIDNTLMVPARDLLASLGATIAWDSGTRTLWAVKTNDVLKIPMDSSTVWLNNQEVQIPVPAQIVNSTAYVPLRFISESLDAEVIWESETNFVSLETVNGEQTSLFQLNSAILEQQPVTKNTPFTIQYHIEPASLPESNFLGSQVTGIRPIALYNISYNVGQIYDVIPENSDRFSGNRGALTLGGNGNSQFKSNLMNGYDQPVAIDSYVDTLPGNVEKATTDAFEKLISQNKKMVTVALVDSLDLNGKKPVQINGFAVFELTKDSEGQIKGIYRGDGRATNTTAKTIQFQAQFPPIFDVQKPADTDQITWEIRSNLQSGSTLIGNIKDVAFSKDVSTGNYTASDVNFNISVTPRQSGVHALNNSILTYKDLSSIEKTEPFNALLISVVTPVDNLTLNKTEISRMEMGTSETLVATVRPEDATNKSVIWTSSNESVATVDADGVVKAIGVGNAVITATSAENGKKKASCSVTVVPAPAIAPQFELSQSAIIGDYAIIKITPDLETITEQTKWYKYDKVDGVWQWVNFNTGLFQSSGSGNTGITLEKQENPHGKLTFVQPANIKIKAVTEGKSTEKVLEINFNNSNLFIDNSGITFKINSNETGNAQNVAASGNRAARVSIVYNIKLPDDIRVEFVNETPKYVIKDKNGSLVLNGPLPIDGINGDSTPVIKFLKSSTGSSQQYRVQATLDMMLTTTSGEKLPFTLHSDALKITIQSREKLR